MTSTDLARRVAPDSTGGLSLLHAQAGTLADLIDNPDRFLQTVAIQVQQNPQLAQCDPDSFLAAAFLSAQLRLEPGPQGLCWWIPRKRRVTWMLGYRGVKALAERHPNVISVTAHTVYENDVEFTEVLGANPTLVHRPAAPGVDRGRPIAWYAVAQLVQGPPIFRVLRPEDVEARRKCSSAPDSPAWASHYDAMARKSCIRAMQGDLPADPALSLALQHDDTAPTLAAVAPTPRPQLTIPAEDEDTVDVTVDPDPAGEEVVEEDAPETARDRTLKQRRRWIGQQASLHGFKTDERRHALIALLTDGTATSGTEAADDDPTWDLLRARLVALNEGDLAVHETLDGRLHLDGIPTEEPA